jgi:hypothetical protein
MSAHHKLTMTIRATLTNLIHKKNKHPIDLYIAGILLCAIITVIVILSNYANCYQEAESVISFTPAVLDHGTAFSTHDFVNIFNVWDLDNGWNRPRFLSYTSYILAVKSRLLLWDFLRPHPTLSFLWLFTLLLAPWLFYKYLKIILKDTTAACAGVAVYISTCGYLFASTMFMHPGKPLLNVVIIAILYLLAKNQPPIPANKINPLFNRSMIWGIIPLLTASLFLDEMATFCFVLPIVWHIRYFLPYGLTLPNVKTCVQNILIYCVPAVILLFMVLLVAPYVAQHAFGKSYSFFGCIAQNAHVTQVNFELLRWNTLTLFSASLLPWSLLHLRVPVPDDVTGFNYLGIQIYYTLLFCCTLYLFTKTKKYRGLIIKIFLLTGLFIFLQSLNISFHIQKIVITGYYYGAPFGILFATFIAIMIAILNTEIPGGKWIARILLVAIVILQFMNFLMINISWKTHSDWKSTVGVATVNLDTTRGRIIYLIKKKLKTELQSEYKVYYPGNITPIDPLEKLHTTEEFWKQWKASKCDLFAQKHDMMFVQNMWLYGELCPKEFKEFYGQ